MPENGAEAPKAVIAWQVGTLIAAAIVASVVWSRGTAVAVAYGGAAAVIPTLYAAIKVLQARGTGVPEVVAGTFFRAEIGKFALTAVLFAMGVKLFASEFMAVLAGFMVCQLAYWIELGRIAMRERHRALDRDKRHGG
jgi:F0F1-type ATP synthase assembly protein I